MTINDKAQITALVPMRHDSERVRGKNYRPLGGIPLFHHIVRSLLGCSLISQVVIDTDSDLISASAAEAFPDVIVLERPEHLLGGEVPMNEVLLHDIEMVPADLYVQTHSTNPLLRTETIERALSTLLEQRDVYDSLFTVTPLQVRLWTEAGKPINHDRDVLLRTQDLPPVMMENSCLYVFDGPTLKRSRNRIGTHPLLFALDPQEAWDIDDELGWKVVELLYGASQDVP